MSRTSRNFVVAYILLVGIPLLCLAGVLKAGRSVSAPISVDGTWKIEADTSSLAGQPCGKALLAVSGSPVVISQSGKGLAFTSNNPAKTVGSGLIEGTNVTASFQTSTVASAGCNSDSRVIMTATVNPKSEPRTLAGSFTASDCASCGTLQFHASRQPKAQSGGSH
jgi:hypothetical protein